MLISIPFPGKNPERFSDGLNYQVIESQLSQKI